MWWDQDPAANNAWLNLSGAMDSYSAPSKGYFEEEVPKRLQKFNSMDTPHYMRYGNHPQNMRDQTNEMVTEYNRARRNNNATLLGMDQPAFDPYLTLAERRAASGEREPYTYTWEETARQKGVPIMPQRPGSPPDINRPAEPWEAPGFTPASGFGTNAGALPTQRGWVPPGPTQSDPDMMAGMQDPILARINKAIGTGQTVPATGNTGPVGGHILGLLFYLLGQAPKLPGILQQSSVPNPQWLLDPKFWQGYQRNVVGPNNGQY